MKPLIISFLFFTAIYSFGQVTISGIVQTKKEIPLSGATVFISNTYDGGLADADGKYSFTTMATGENKLIVKFIGYETDTILITIQDTDLEFDFVLKEKFNELTAVTINAGAFEASDKKKSVTLNAIDMVTVPGAQGSVIGAMQYLPGTTTNGESGKLFVRGGSSRESQTYIDGTIVPVAYNPSAPNTAVRSKFNPFMFDGTVFSTGGFSAEYGQALSSVLLLETKGIQEQDQLDISILSVGLGLAGTKKWDTGAITLSLDHTNLIPYLALFPQTIDWVKAPITNNAGLNFRQKTKKGLFKFYSTYNDSYFELNQLDINNLQGNGQTPTPTNYILKNKNYYANTSWLSGLGKNWIFKTGLAFTYNDEEVRIEDNTFNETLLYGHLKAVVSRNLSKKIKLKIGTEAHVKEYEQNYKTPTEEFPTDFTDNLYATFAETNIYLSKKLVTRIGGRFEYSSYLNSYNLSPRLSMAYQTGKHSQISIATGTFYQRAKDNYLIFSNQIDFERSTQYMVNFQRTKNKRTFRVEAYLKKYSDLVKFDNSTPFYSPTHYTNNGNGYAQGIDLFFRDKKTIKNGDYWISYSYLDTKRNELNFTNEAVPGYASKHNISVIYKHWIGKWRSLVGASFNYSSPRFYNDPNQAVFNNEKMKAYQSLNLNWSFLYRENIIFYASASNVLGYQQAYGYEFSSTPNSEGVFEKRLIEPPAARFYVLGCFITLSKSGDKNQLDKIN